MFANSSFDRDFNRVKNTAVVIFIINFAFGVFIAAVLVTGIVWSAKEIKKSGVKGLVNTVWNGPQEVKKTSTEVGQR